MFRYQGVGVVNEKGKLLEVVGKQDGENKNIGVNRNEIPQLTGKNDLGRLSNKDELVKAQGKCGDYRGYVSKTISGKKCMAWNSQSPHKHDRTPEKYPGSGIGDHNYCRNPDGEPTIWCYTTDSNSRFEFC
jgi:hypothetical protein